MTPYCPYCGQQLQPTTDRACPSCGREVPMLVAAGRHQELVQFRDTVFQMTPRTWAIPAIVAANILVFVIMVLSGVSLMNPRAGAVLDWGANFGPFTLNGQWWRLVTCMFLHFGIIHIGFNMYVLWQIGHLVERLAGNIGLLVLYLTSGIAASIASLAWNPFSVSAGASGAVFGVCGALLGFIILRRDTIPRDVVMGLRSSLITFVIYNVVIGMAVPQIDMAAHAGGFVYGILCGLVLSLPVRLDSIARRWRRNLALLLGSAVLLPGSFMMLPLASQQQVLREWPILFRDEEASLAWQQLASQHDQNAISDDALAQSLETEVLPKLREAQELIRKQIEKRRRNPTERQRAIQQYVQDRLQAMQQIVVGLRTGDGERVRESVATWNASGKRKQELFPHRDG